MLDVGDLLYTVNGKLVRGLDISEVVKLIVGMPNSRVRLEVLRENSAVEIPPTPVMIAPYERKEVVLQRKLGPSDPRDSQIAGLGLLFHKVHN